MVDIFLFIQQEFLLVTALVVLIIVFFKRESKLAGDKISVGEAVQAMNGDDAVMIDIREKKDFDSGHIANAVNIPFAKITNGARLFEQYKTKRIILADKMGQQTGSVGKTLKKEGLDVYRLSGGIEEWKAQTLPLVK